MAAAVVVVVDVIPAVVVVGIGITAAYLWLLLLLLHDGRSGNIPSSAGRAELDPVDGHIGEVVHGRGERVDGTDEPAWTMTAQRKENVSL